MIRSFFFAPANRPDLVVKFPRFGADCCVIDLGDGTPPRREAARTRVAARHRATSASRRTRGHEDLRPLSRVVLARTRQRRRFSARLLQGLHGMNPERVLLAAEAIGIGKVALKKAAGYAKERVVLDRPIGKNQAIQHPLAANWVELEAAQLLMMKAAWLYDNVKECGAAANAAR
ncbi:MAG: hypothetical protein IT492_13285 [Gammaproteobacteria bacterium]|nr:hypothetical protein [Gammaproteobacteria bacterium]